VHFRIAADAVALLHGAFVAFVVLGGFAAWRWRRLLWLHVPAAAWGAIVELMAWPCPLTPLEQSLRRAAGENGYSGGFTEHYLLPLLYPPGLTAPTQLALGLFVIAVNALAYGVLLSRRRRSPQRG
jgi:hypothetical protein